MCAHHVCLIIKRAVQTFSFIVVRELGLVSFIVGLTTPTLAG
jgi:hypothetical protein